MEKHQMTDSVLQARLMNCGLGDSARQTSVSRDAKWAVSLCLALILLLAWGHAVDTDAQEADAYASGVVVGRAEMAETVAAAYWQGQADAALIAAPCRQWPQLDRRPRRVALREALCAQEQP